MGYDPSTGPIRTRRLELAVLPATFVEDITAGNLESARRSLGASVGRWLADDPSHLVQIALAGRAAELAGYAGFARVIIAATASDRRAIGSIGFHGPPDEADRLEVSCRIHPARRGRGFGAEATTGLLDWATARFGITRFLLAVPSRRDGPDPVPIVIASHRPGSRDEDIEALADLLEGQRPRVPRG
jgi:RimJ/RimL family protein N-acetyltransferase